MTEQDQNQQEKKIIVDEDWKREAQREKEILAAQEKAEKEKQKAARQRPRAPLPRGDFAALISTLATQALFAMGLIRVEGHEQDRPNLELARFNIDMLETLEQKTRGNLTEAEDRVLKNTLTELRMSFVRLAEKVASDSES